MKPNACNWAYFKRFAKHNKLYTYFPFFPINCIIVFLYFPFLIQQIIEQILVLQFPRWGVLNFLNIQIDLQDEGSFLDYSNLRMRTSMHSERERENFQNFRHICIKLISKKKTREAQSDKPYLGSSYIFLMPNLIWWAWRASSSRCLRDPRSVCVKEQIRGDTIFHYKIDGKVHIQSYLED